MLNSNQKNFFNILLAKKYRKKLLFKLCIEFFESNEVYFKLKSLILA